MRIYSVTRGALRVRNAPARDNNGDAQGKRHAGQGQVGGQVHGTETGQRHETVYYIKKHGQCQREQERGEEVARKDEGRIRIDIMEKIGATTPMDAAPTRRAPSANCGMSSLKRKKDRSGKANRRMSTRPLTVPGIRRVWVKRLRCRRKGNRDTGGQSGRGGGRG